MSDRYNDINASSGFNTTVRSAADVAGSKLFPEESHLLVTSFQYFKRFEDLKSAMEFALDIWPANIWLVGKSIKEKYSTSFYAPQVDPCKLLLQGMFVSEEAPMNSLWLSHGDFAAQLSEDLRYEWQQCAQSKWLKDNPDSE